MNITLYSNHCPQCMLLKTKLNERGIQYEEINDIDIMLKKGFMSMPILVIDGEILKFAEALKWVNKQ